MASEEKELLYIGILCFVSVNLCCEPCAMELIKKVSVREETQEHCSWDKICYVEEACMSVWCLEELLRFFGMNNSL